MSQKYEHVKHVKQRATIFRNGESKILKRSIVKFTYNLLKTIGDRLIKRSS